MRYLSLFSGIESASVAWEPLGWTPVAFAEIERFPSQVLAHHWPHVPNLGDVTKIDASVIQSLGPIDLVVGGWPCTDVSVAGQRKGFTNEDGSATRSGLFYELARILGLCRDIAGARWFVGENVPGLLSSSGGTDFSSVLSTLSGHDVRLAPGKKWKTGGVCTNFGPRDWGVAWRVLDAQHFGVPQRRRRVFIVGHLGDHERAAQVLLEPSSLLRDTPPRRKALQDTSGLPPSGAPNGGVSGTLFGSGAGVERPAGTPANVGATPYRESVCDGSPGFGLDRLVRDVTCVSSKTMNDVSDAVPAGRSTIQTILGDVTHTLTHDGFDASEDGTGRGTPIIANNTGQGYWMEDSVAQFVRSGDSQGRGGARESTLVCADVAPTIPSRSTAGGGLGTDVDLNGGLIVRFSVHPPSERTPKVAAP